MLCQLYDRLHHAWDSDRARRLTAALLVIVFLVGLLAIELGRHGLIFEHPPGNHFYAIEWALTLLLAFEVLDLVFWLSGSVSHSAGKQLEIFSLVLLRKTFSELKSLPEPIEIATFSEPVQRMVSDAVGALIIFFLVGIYYRLQKHVPISEHEGEQKSFQQAKKRIALGLLFAFVGLAIFSAIGMITGRPKENSFFEVFYTILIFADVLVALVSIRYSISYRVVFRYFGLAAMTLFIRLALSSPSYLKAGLGIGAAIYAVALAYAYNRVVIRE